MLLVAAPWVLGLLNLDTRLWVAERSGAGRGDDDNGQAESLFYDQPARIAAAVQRVRAGQPGKTGVYFVGFAGDGDQALFRREAQFASRGVRHALRHRASARYCSSTTSRIATPTRWRASPGLGQTLRLLASRMNTEKDVLVLFLTSHGSQDGLEVQNGSLPLAQLAPADLREVLDASGIRWRIIVVSACYAGRVPR